MAVIDEKLNKEAYSAATEMAKSGVGAQPRYEGTFDQQISDLYDRIQNREKFKFNLNGNALYQQYKDQAVQGGKLAMRDTMGRAAALTGGYGSSYAQSVGQQAYDAQLQKLSEVVPELYRQAYEQYRDEGSDLQQQYAMAGKLASDEYSKYRDRLSDWQYERAWEQQQADTAYTRQKAEESEAYSRQQDAYKQLYQLIAGAGYQPTEAELKAAGMSMAAATALRNAWEKANGGGGSSGGGGYYGGGGTGSSYETAAETVGMMLDSGESYSTVREAILSEPGLNKAQQTQLLEQAAARAMQDARKSTGSTMTSRSAAAKKTGNGGR